jgi:hypothetical protein
VRLARHERHELGVGELRALQDPGAQRLGLLAGLDGGKDARGDAGVALLRQVDADLPKRPGLALGLALGPSPCFALVPAHLPQPRLHDTVLSEHVPERGSIIALARQVEQGGHRILGLRPGQRIQLPHGCQHLPRLVPAPQQRHESQRPRLSALEREVRVDLPQAHHVEAPLVGEPVADVQAERVRNVPVRTGEEVQDGRQDGRVVVEDQARVVLEAAAGHVGVALRLKLQVAVPDEAVALEAEHRVDPPAGDGKVDTLDGGDADVGPVFADEGEEALALALEEHLDRSVGVHDGRLPFRESEAMLSRPWDRAGPLT